MKDPIADASALLGEGPIPEPQAPRSTEDSVTDGQWWTLFEDPPATPPRRRGIRVIAAIVLACVACIAVAAVLVMVLPNDTGDDPEASPQRAQSSASSADTSSERRLLRSIPSGYPPDRCASTPSPNGVVSVACGASAAPDGPASATFTLVRDKRSLTAAFDDVVRSMTVVNCPGNIQSPGAWYATAAPQLSRGMLVCGFSKDIPIIAWTNEGKQLVSIVRDTKAGGTIDDLYRWWSVQS